MYRNKYICLLKYIDTLPPPSELGKISILITSLHITREYKLEINWAKKKKMQHNIKCKYQNLSKIHH